MDCAATDMSDELILLTAGLDSRQESHCVAANVIFTCVTFPFVAYPRKIMFLS